MSDPSRHLIPVPRPGARVGLLGGSFDPPHKGHVHITNEALRRFGLDQVWWLVTPGNPLKENGPAPLQHRLSAARQIMQHPRVTVTDIEARIGTRYTAQTLAKLAHLYPSTQFVWLMGADNLTSFHRWDQWQWIMENFPIGVLARPKQRIPARMSVAANRYRNYRLPASHASRLAFHQAPVWSLVNMPMIEISSTEIRAKGTWKP